MDKFANFPDQGEPLSEEKLQSFADVPPTLTVTPVGVAGTSTEDNKEKVLQTSLVRKTKVTDKHLTRSERKNENKKEILAKQFEEKKLENESPFFGDMFLQENELHIKQEIVDSNNQNTLIKEPLPVVSRPSESLNTNQEDDSAFQKTLLNIRNVVEKNIKSTVKVAAASSVSGEIKDQPANKGEQNKSDTPEDRSLELMDTESDEQKGTKRKTIDEEENQSPPKISKVMAAYNPLPPPEVEEYDKVQLYSRIRNFMRHSARIRGYVELHLRANPQLAQNSEIKMHNSYIDEHYPSDESRKEEKQAAVDSLWRTMLLLNQPEPNA